MLYSRLASDEKYEKNMCTILVFMQLYDGHPELNNKRRSHISLICPYSSLYYLCNLTLLKEQNQSCEIK